MSRVTSRWAFAPLRPYVGQVVISFTFAVVEVATGFWHQGGRRYSALFHDTRLLVKSHDIPSQSFPRMENKPVKTWVFTLNNWTPTELDNILHWDVTRLVVGEEVGDEGTPHLQGAVTFKRAYRLAALKKLQSRAHWEIALAADAFNYCGKDGNMVHRIDNRTQGKRRDIDVAYEAVAAKKPMRAFLAEDKPSYQAIQVFKVAAAMAVPDRVCGEDGLFPEIDVRWYYGATGTGKSASVYREFMADVYRPLSEKWWDGYTGQRCVLVDDFRPKWCSWERLLQLTDRYPLTLEVKGGSVAACWTVFVITAPEPPSEMFAAFGEDVRQLTRRIRVVRRFFRGPDGSFEFVDEE